LPADVPTLAVQLRGIVDLEVLGNEVRV
jgi:hypothetical protein